jgi:hypothetical protein
MRQALSGEFLLFVGQSATAEGGWQNALVTKSRVRGLSSAFFEHLSQHPTPAVRALFVEENTGIALDCSTRSSSC